ncbi:multisubunit sodium/proton antiporter, MrpC subunit (TC 2.A.63.1) [Klenkia soli]|uniref:Multisubunit sodium/proton antiporter, MrpC subunit (TC 2.A.63.1) n=1 Tax=Klenkia soli TaxID=1052260 RepID=A0A1H0N237_9ACTN|nr:Na(+)/H(+) antiporter subunit C [Klenkia soli]SDO86595.1 multisubunit sodium/proton antiporter, MrpC subunit (TC 2.A.63.1) [Klenkia soli]
MTPTVVLPIIIAGLYAAGVYLLLDRSLTRVLLGFLLLGNATNVLLLSAGGVAGLAPILPVDDESAINDPLPQALVLTAIVITFGISAFVLAMIYRSWRLVRDEVVQDDAEDLRVATREEIDADERDPEEMDPADRGPGDGFTVEAGPHHPDGRDTDTPSDDVGLGLAGAVEAENESAEARAVADPGQLRAGSQRDEPAHHRREEEH